MQNKALTVIAAPAGVGIQGQVRITDLGPARRVSLINLFVDVPPSTVAFDEPGLFLRDNAGVVRAQNCFFRGSFHYGSSISLYAGCGAEVTRSGKVIFNRCTLIGRGMGFELSGEWSRAGGDGLRAVDSGVALYDCQSTGGHGSEETYPAGGDGGTGCRVTRVGVFSAGSNFKAGNSGGGDFVGCTSQGNGGHGLVLTDAQAQLFSTTLIPGFATGYWSCHPGHDGRRFVKSGESVLNEFTGPHFKLSGPTYVTDNSGVPLVVEGAPGSSVFLLVGDGSGFHYVSAWSNVVANPAPWSPHPLGTVGANSTLNAVWSVPDIASPRPA